MLEYYCPNCNATLDDQPGFDPALGTWKCTECGQGLMDDDIYYGDTFEGIVWRCDNCNSLLNRQDGFSDSYGSWICTECGYANSITEDDIYDSEEDYLNHKNSNTEDSYYNNESKYEDDSRTIYYCPNCSEVLNEQCCFDEYTENWTCTYCCTKLHRDYTFEEFEIAEESNKENSSDASSTSNDTSDYCYHSDTIYTEVDSEDENEEDEEPVSTKKDKSWIALVVCFIILLGIPLGILLKFEIEEKIAISEGKINAGFYRDLVGEDYKTVTAHFDSAGFTNVELIDLNDSGILFWRNGKVKTISIAGNSTFESTDWFDPDSKVVISYH